MSPEQLVARLEHVQVVDVRWPNEWNAGRIEGALHIPLDRLDDRSTGLDRSRPVVTVCRQGNRSSDAAEQLVHDGFAAESLEGGMEAWAAAGLPITTPDGEPGEVVEPQPPPDDRPEHLQRLEKEFLRVLFEVQEHFGDREPGDEEVRAFLYDRLLEEGRSPEEAAAFMASLDEQPS